MTNDHEDTVTARKAASRLRAQDADEHVRARLRECRIMRGMTHHRLAELAGISYQQEHKYETGGEVLRLLGIRGGVHPLGG
jgi:DNA-binding XRE family transcriptional regulator